MFNSSLGGWDVADEETRKKKRNMPKIKLRSTQQLSTHYIPTGKAIVIPSPAGPTQESFNRAR